MTISKKNILGISAGYHDAGITVINPNTGDIVFASHSERFTKKKHDPEVGSEIISYANSLGQIGTIAYYENHWLKKWRQLRAGQEVDKHLTLRTTLKEHFVDHRRLLDNSKVVSYTHHKSHAAAGFQTSKYSAATVVVIDAIGEMDTISIWQAHYNKDGFAQYKKMWSQKYPNSIGLFYSAVTKSVGLRPLDEEYILMGMAAYGKVDRSANKILRDLVDTMDPPTFNDNLHIGIESLQDENINEFDVAAGAQYVVEQMISNVIAKSKHYDISGNLVFMGGVALNCSANRLIGKYYNNIWIMPNPGDAGSSLGAAALAYGKKINWNNAFHGYNIGSKLPVDKIVEHLKEHKIAGVASGKAEFGPRALGNRSLLADPRGDEIKDQVNEIKRRQKFRPFAPMILAEHVHEYFIMPRGFSDSDYMQVTAKCRKPDQFPAVVHEDFTSRVQTVQDDGSDIRKLLEAWYKETGCPILLNTSLNIRGEPMVNDRSDAKRFEKEYGVKVFTAIS